MSFFEPKITKTQNISKAIDPKWVKKVKGTCSRFLCFKPGKENISTYLIPVLIPSEQLKK